MNENKSLYGFGDVHDVFTKHGMSLDLRYAASCDAGEGETNEMLTYAFEGEGEFGTPYYGEITTWDYTLDDVTFWAYELDTLLFDGIKHSVFSDYYGSIDEAPDYEDIERVANDVLADLEALSKDEMDAFCEEYAA